MKSLSQVIEIYKGLSGSDNFIDALWVLDKDIDKLGMFVVAKSVGALNEDGSAEEFSIAHMTAFNNAFGGKY